VQECTEVSFDFEAHFAPDGAGFDGGTLASGAGTLLLRQVDRRIDLVTGNDRQGYSVDESPVRIAGARLITVAKSPHYEETRKTAFRA